MYLQCLRFHFRLSLFSMCTVEIMRHEFYIKSSSFLTTHCSIKCAYIRNTLFYKQSFFSTQSKCRLTFLWIKLQMLLRCCLIHIIIIILRHFFFYLWFLFVFIKTKKIQNIFINIKLDRNLWKFVTKV